MANTVARKKTATKKAAKTASKKTATKQVKTKPTAQKSKASRPAGKDKPIKYADKSAGQPEMILLFEELKNLLRPYAKAPLVERGDNQSQYALWNDKQIEVAGRLRDDVFFVGLLIQKGYVGFYFMPVYANPSLKAQLPPQFVKCLKGKSCFHIKKNDPELMQQVKDALKIGYDDYKRKGWV